MQQKKKKIKSWNNIITLNKNIVGRIEDIDNNKNIVQISLNYLNDDYATKDLSFTKLQEKLLIYFNENKLMEKFIKSFCIINNHNFNEIWYSIIHNLDSERRNNNDNDNISLWIYFCNNINNLKINDELIYEQLKKLYIKKNEILNQKIISRFGIISNEGINKVKDIFNKVLLKISDNYNYNLYYDSTPYYIFETESIKQENNNDLNLLELHNIFINNITNEINNKTLFIKIDYIGKIL